MIKLHHPITGAEVEVKREVQAKILERSGWQRGVLPAAKVGTSLKEPRKVDLSALYTSKEVSK